MKKYKQTGFNQIDGHESELGILNSTLAIYNEYHEHDDGAGFDQIKKEGYVLFNEALNTFYLQLCRIGHMIKVHSDSKREEGRKEMFYFTTHSTHFIYTYMASDIW